MDLDVLHAEVVKLKKIIGGAAALAENADKVMELFGSVGPRLEQMEADVKSFVQSGSDRIAAVEKSVADIGEKVTALTASVDALAGAFESITPTDAPADAPATPAPPAEQQAPAEPAPPPAA